MLKTRIARFVLRTRQYLAAVKPERGLRLLQLMRFASEIAEPAGLNTAAGEQVTKKELDMAKHLVATMSESWRPEQYTDEYRASLLEVIQQKVQGEAKAGRRAPAAPLPGKVVNLINVLQQSLAQSRGGAKKAEPKRKKIA